MSIQNSLASPPEPQRFLVAEENKHVADILRSALAQHPNAQVDVAKEGDSAYDLLGKNKYDIAILNATLPLRDGLWLTRYIRQERKDTDMGILLLSAKGRVEDRVQGLGLGADDFLAKPFDLHELLARIETIARIRGLQMEVQRRGDLIQARNRQIETDLDIARRVQLAILPSSLPVNDKARFYARYIPREKVGGDFYDVFELDEGQYGVFIGDVSGHGVPSAFIMTMANMLLRIHAKKDISPATVISDTNQVFCGRIIDEYYLTVFYAIVDLSSGCLRHSRAGHPSPLIYHARENRIERIETEGLLLGRFTHATYQEGRLLFRSGDKILLFTDGIFECTNPQDMMLGPDRFQEWFRLAASKFGGNELLEELLRKSREFQQTELFVDDVTLLLIEIP